MITELNRRRVHVVRLDPGDFPERVTVNAEFGSHRLAGTVSDGPPRPYSAPGRLAGQDRP